VPRLAIVISAIGSIESLEGTLVSVLENRPADCEILVVLNKPYSDPYDLKDEVRFVQSTARVSSIHGVNQALTVTRAPFVNLLASGCQVTEGWTDEVLSRFGDRQMGSVVPLVLDAEHRERIFAAGLGYRRGGKRYLVGHGRTELAPDDQASIVGPCGFAAFYRKAALDLAGGLNSHLGNQQADVDLALALRTAGFAMALEPRSRIYATADVDRSQRALSTSFHDERLFWGNLPSQGRTGSLAAHAGVVAAELLRSFPRPRMLAQLAGRVLACCQLGSSAHRRNTLDPLSQPSAGPKPALHRVRVDRPHHGQSLAEPTQSRVHSS
jgi:GT2 family glycosyltransferase